MTMRFGPGFAVSDWLVGGARQLVAPNPPPDVTILGATDTEVQLFCSEPGTIFTLVNTAAAPLAGAVIAAGGGLANSSFPVVSGVNTPSIPMTALPAGDYFLHITERDAGDAYSDDDVLAFTREGSAVVLSSSVPADNATDVALDANIVLTFSAAVTLNAGSFTLWRNVASVWTLVETWDVATEVGTGAGQVSVAGAVVTLNPAADLVLGAEYAIQWTGAALLDAAGDPVAALSDTTTVSFTATAVLPTFTTVAGQLTNFNDPNAWPTGNGKATIAVIANLTGTGGSQWLYEMGNIHVGLECTNARLLRLTIKDSAGTTLMSSVGIGTIPAFGTEFEVIVAIDLVALTVWTTLNGTTTTHTVAANTGALASATRKLRFLSRATVGNYAIGTFRKLECWTDCVTGGGRPPTDTALRKRITGPASVANLDAWKLGGDTV